MRGLGKHALRILVIGGWATWCGTNPAPAQERSQDVAWGRKKCPPPVCPTPEIEKPAVEPGKEPRPPETPPTPQPELAPERAVALGSEETVALAAPNMIGNLLGGSRSVSFFINRTQDAVVINGLGSTNSNNPKVDENNIELPEDRAYFRYNFDSQATSVTGIGGTPQVAFSGGLSIGLPTADDTNVRVTDFLGLTNVNSVDIERVRDFHIGNNTVSISPYLAVLFKPTERFFIQGFTEFDFPVNSS